jgi:hypothetical protein
LGSGVIIFRSKGLALLVGTAHPRYDYALAHRSLREEIFDDPCASLAAFRHFDFAKWAVRCPDLATLLISRIVGHEKQKRGSHVVDCINALHNVEVVLPLRRR